MTVTSFEKISELIGDSGIAALKDVHAHVSIPINVDKPLIGGGISGYIQAGAYPLFCDRVELHFNDLTQQTSGSSNNLTLSSTWRQKNAGDTFGNFLGQASLEAAMQANNKKHFEGSQPVLAFSRS